MIVDTHLHTRSNGAAPFTLLPGAPPPAEGLGESAEELLTTMNQCDVHGAVLVQWNSRHGYDNAYAADAVRRHPACFAGVCSIDVDPPDASDRAAYWIGTHGMRGIRLFNGFAVAGGKEPVWIDDARTLAAIERAHALGAPITVMSALAGLPAVLRVARAHPEIPLVLDHLALAEDAQALEPLAGCANVSLKFSTGVMVVAHAGSTKADEYRRERALIDGVLRRFGAERLMWGSNYPQSPVPYADIVALSEILLAGVSARERGLVMGGNAQRLWPSLAASGAGA